MTGCKSVSREEAGEKDYKIGVVTKSEGSEYWMSVCSGMEKAAESRKVQVVVLSPDTEINEKMQKQMIEDLLKMDVDALAVSPIDSYDNEDYIRKAEEKGIPVFSYDTPIEDVDVPYIGIDNEKAGYELARVMAETLEHKGEIAVISGDTGQASHKKRVEGFQKYMEQESEITIKMVKSGYSNLRVSEREIEKIRQEYPQLDGIMTTSAVTALGIAEAMEDLGIAIASVDVQKDAIRSVEEGKITALADQSGYDIGYETICYIDNERNGVEQEKNKILETKILTRENLKK
ncbi:MAG: substrate-binding domain-containing protein [Clostridiales bacterium]|nr:substrate-binding domain-containing protein [Clostridiales bacterium]